MVGAFVKERPPSLFYPRNRLSEGPARGRVPYAPQDVALRANRPIRRGGEGLGYQPMRPSADRPQTDRLVTVVEAAAILGITPDAVRSRLRRGTLHKETGEDGTVYVRLDGDGRDGHADQATDRTTDQPTVAYINALRSENELLRRELEDRKEESRRKDHIIMTLAQRVPELEAPREPPGGHEAPAGETDRSEPRPATGGAQEATERRPWWRRWFGFE